MTDDFSIFSGSYADLNSDGKVDLGEYLMDEIEYNDIMGEEPSDDDSYDDDNCSCSDDDDYSEDDTDEYSSTRRVSFKLEVYDGEDILCDDGVHRKGEKNKNNIEEYYYDDYDNCYCTGRAVWAHFKIVRDNFEIDEAVKFEDVIEKIYKFSRKAGLEILLWVIENFPKSLIDAWDQEHWEPINYHLIFGAMAYYDEHTKYDNMFCDYIYSHRDFERLITEKRKIKTPYFICEYYLPHLIDKNDITRFKEIYWGVLNNKNLNETYRKYDFLEDIIYNTKNCKTEIGTEELYLFLTEEINSLNKPIKIKDLYDRLNNRIFCGLDFSEFENKRQGRQKELLEKSARIDRQIADLKNQIENLEYEKRKLNI